MLFLTATESLRFSPHTDLVPLHPQPQPELVASEDAASCKSDCDGADGVFEAGADRIRSVTASPALPLLDIASRRAREAARPVMDETSTGVCTKTVFICLACEALDCFPPANADLPFVAKARLRSREASRALLLAAICAIPNPIASSCL